MSRTLIDPHHPDAGDFATEAERIGVSSLWVPEVWGYDALTGLAHVAARTTTIGLGTFVVQLGSRSPALLATSALSLQSLSGGRFRLGIGVSGPQVMEGWHGVRFRRPVQTTRETIEIVRTVSRGERLEHAARSIRCRSPTAQGAALRPMVAPAEVPDLRRRDGSGEPRRSPASSPTGGSATPSSPRRPRRSSVRCARAP